MPPPATRSRDELAPEDFRWVYLLAGVEDIRGADGERIDRLFREAIRLAPAFRRPTSATPTRCCGSGAGPRPATPTRRRSSSIPIWFWLTVDSARPPLLLGDGPAAVEHLERAAALAPEDRITQVALARAYALAGRREQAAEAARKAETLTAQA